jgi:hypothetical protein
MRVLLVFAMSFAWVDAARAEDEDEETEDAEVDPFLDTRLTFTLGDDDFLSPTGEQLPVSSFLGAGDRPQYELFYDNLDTRFSSRENVTHLVAHRELPAFFDDLTTEAAVVLRFDFGEGPFVEDAGSYLRVRYNPWIESPDDGLALTFFPLDSDRMRLGFLYDLSVGGDEFLSPRFDGLGGLEGLGNRFLQAPGARFELDRDFLHTWVGAKFVPERSGATVAVEGSPGTFVVLENRYSVMGGVAFDLFDQRLRIDAGGGYFQQARLFGLPGYATTTLGAAAAVARIAWRRELALEESIDTTLYGNDPNLPLRYFGTPDYVPGQLAYFVSVEGVAVSRTLADSDAVGETTQELGLAGAFRTRVQYDFARFELSAVYRDVPFLLKDTTRAIPLVSIPDEAALSPEAFFALTADYHFVDARLTLEASGGLELPAALRVDRQIEGVLVDRTTVVRGDGTLTVLPAGETESPIVHARVAARLDLSEMFYSRLWVQYVYDPNVSSLQLRDPDGVGRAEFIPLAHRLGAGLAVAARF